MGCFVLVHGAWHGGWCWREVARILRRRGHDVHTPTLTGLGERHHLAHPEVGLSTHIEDVANLLVWEDLDQVVLVGHSYGGMVITGVADRLPARIAHLVYLDAFVPADGQRVMDLLPPGRAEEFRAQAAADGDGWRMPPVPAERFGVTDPLDRAWVDGKCLPMAIKAFEEPIALSGGQSPIAERSFVLAGDYSPSAFHEVHRRLRDDPAWRVHSLPTGHDMMITMPEALAGILDPEA